MGFGLKEDVPRYPSRKTAHPQISFGEKTMNRKFVTFVGMACLSAGMLWADVSSGHATGKRQHGLKSKHKHTSKSSIHALNPQPLPPGRKQALVSNETMKTQGNGGGTIKPDLNP